MNEFISYMVGLLFLAFAVPLAFFLMLDWAHFLYLNLTPWFK